MDYHYNDYNMGEGAGRNAGRTGQGRRASSYSGARAGRKDFTPTRTRGQSDWTGEDELAQRIMQQAMSSEPRSASSTRNGAKKKRNRTRRRIITMIVLEIFTLAAIFAYAKFTKYYDMIQKPEVDAEYIKNTEIDITTAESMKGYWTIAVFGVDSRGTNVSKGTNSDVNIICNINRDTGEIRLVSVFRDSYLNLGDEVNSYNKINQAYAVGGPQQALKALNKNLDLNIENYITFNWKAVADGINILGGVEIDISKAELYYINAFITETQKATGIPTRQLSKTGLQTLDGVQAVAYGRLRLMDTDYARTERQKKVISKAFEKAKKADWAALNNIMVTTFPQVATNIELDDIIKEARNITKYHMGESTGFPMARDEKNMGKKGACVIPQTLESNVKSLHKFLFDNESYIPSSSVKTLSKKISDDSGLYTAGKEWAPAVTDGGYIPKPTAASRKEESGTKKTTEATEEEETRPTLETDEDGNIVYPTDSHGNAVYPTDSRGNVLTETDSYGRPVAPTRPSGSSAESSPAASSSSPLDETTGALRPGGNGDFPTAAPTSPTTEITKPQVTSPDEYSGPGATTQAHPTPGSSAAPTVPTSPSTSAAAPTVVTTQPANPVQEGNQVSFEGPGQN